jgi:hypothetical protein
VTQPNTNDRIVRVASGQGFWGDSLEAPRQQVEGGPVDYLMLDYLAEVTMSILQKQKERDPSMGYARDFLGAIESVLPAIVDRGVRVIANAGGVNPESCARAVLAVAAKLGAAGKVRVGVVTGDDLLPRLDELLASGHELRHMETGEPLSVIRDRVLSANAYIGSTPIVEALARGANVVVTGRSTDTALTMAPLRHEFGWGAEDWNALAPGSSPATSSSAARSARAGTACTTGARSPTSRTSATRSRRRARTAASSSRSIRAPEGACRSTRSPSSWSTRWAIRNAYITPDVVADFTSIRLEEEGPDRVRVHGIRGRPATDKLKVSIAFRSGWKAVGTLVYAWPDAMEKAELAERVLRERMDRLGLRFDEVLVEYVGANATHGPLAGAPAADLPEVQLRVGVRGGDRASVDASRARSRRWCSTDHQRDRFRRGAPEGGGDRRVLAGARGQDRGPDARGGAVVSAGTSIDTVRVRLLDVAHARSGDKGDTANVGLIALRPEWYPLLAEHVTQSRVAAHFRGMITGEVVRYELPNLLALNFLLHGALGGGGTLSLKTDAQGKVYSTALLRLVLDVPRQHADELGLPVLAG